MSLGQSGRCRQGHRGLQPYIKSPNYGEKEVDMARARRRNEVNLGPGSTTYLLMALSKAEILGFFDAVGFEVLRLTRFWEGGKVAGRAETFKLEQARERRASGTSSCGKRESLYKD
jgi:hypothetical protein